MIKVPRNKNTETASAISLKNGFVMTSFFHKMIGKILHKMQKS